MRIRFLKILMPVLLSIPAFSFGKVFFPTEKKILTLSEQELVKFIHPTASGYWRSGTFGMIGNSGMIFHEGWDIRSFKRDGAGKVLDGVFSVLCFRWSCDLYLFR